MPETIIEPKTKNLNRSKFLYHNQLEALSEERFLNVNKEKGVIKNVHVVTEGEAKGHDFWLNKQFIKDVVAQGKASTTGMKVRFGHPNMSSEALGTYVGRLNNFRLRQVENPDYPDDKETTKTLNIAIADLYMDESARKAPQSSPENNPYDYVLELAETNPDMFGLSIVFRGNGFDEKPKKAKNDVGQERELNQIKLGVLYGADVVDEPAANDRLFHSGTFAETATSFLDDNEQIYDLINENPQILETFLQRYQEYKNNLKTSEMAENTENKVEKTAEVETENLEKEETTEEVVQETTEEVTTEEKSFSKTVLESLSFIKDKLTGKKKEKEEKSDPTAEEIAQFNESKSEILSTIEDIKASLAKKDEEIASLKAEIQEKDSEIAKYQDKEKAELLSNSETKNDNDTAELDAELDPTTKSLREDLAGMKDSLGKTS